MNDQSLLTLRSNRLRLDIVPPEVVSGARWSRVGFISQVTLDGRHTFGGSEPSGGADGVGLCGEFGIFAPVGFDDARSGDWFPKLGLGLLCRPDDEPYQFMRNYQVQPFDIQIESSPDSPNTLRFRCEPLECRGYAVRLLQVLEADENRLRITNELENVGQVPIETHEYRHNFLSIDGVGPGPNLSLSTSFPLVARDEMPVPNLPMRWEQAPTEAFMRRFEGAPPNSWWEMRHADGCSIREQISAPLSAFHLWGAPGKGAPDVVSPEAFVDVRVAPGERQRWQRDYLFDAS